MPLLEGSSDEVVRANIDTLIHKEHYPPLQAVAIAYSKAGRSNKQKKKTGGGKSDEQGTRK